MSSQRRQFAQPAADQNLLTRCDPLGADAELLGTVEALRKDRMYSSRNATRRRSSASFSVRRRSACATCSAFLRLSSSGSASGPTLPVLTRSQGAYALVGWPKDPDTRKASPSEKPDRRGLGSPRRSALRGGDYPGNELHSQASAPGNPTFGVAPVWHTGLKLQLGAVGAATTRQRGARGATSGPRGATSGPRAARVQPAGFRARALDHQRVARLLQLLARRYQHQVFQLHHRLQQRACAWLYCHRGRPRPHRLAI